MGLPRRFAARKDRSKYGDIWGRHIEPKREGDKLRFLTSVRNDRDLRRRMTASEKQKSSLYGLNLPQAGRNKSCKKIKKKLTSK